MNLLLLIDYYLCNTGATVAATAFLKQWHEMKKGNAYICTTTIVGEVDDEIRDYLLVYNNDLQELIEQKQIDVINYFFAARSLVKKSLLTIARESVSGLKRKVVIVTTVCQKPSNKSTLLTAKNIRQSDYLVFIDNASYNDTLYHFIPKSRKSRIYFGGTKDYIEKTGRLAETKKSNGDKFVYGRGSTLSKCPKDILAVFDRINVVNKYFKIAGVYKDSWLGLQAENRDDVEVIPPVPYSDWLMICSRFDVFLYYLPNDTPSSIDGTLGDAMLMKIPPIVYGPAAPKERIIHGENGFIANTKDEIINYAELLYHDADLRKRMGEAARSSQIEMFSFAKTIDDYKSLYDKLLSGANQLSPIEVPLKNAILLLKEKYLFSFFVQLYCAAKTKYELYRKKK